MTQLVVTEPEPITKIQQDDQASSNSSSLLDRIYAFLQHHYKDLEGTFYSRTDNAFGRHPEYLFDTPHGYWGGEPTDPLPPDHSDRFWKAAEQMIVNATKIIDIINLGLPSAQFKQAIIRGIANNKSLRASKPLLVRILAGRSGLTWMSDDTKRFVSDVHAAIKNERWADFLSLYVGAQRVDRRLRPVGWNHGKYLAVDGSTILFGGHNFIGEPYFGVNPIFDLSIKLDGPVTVKAHLFSDQLWKFVNKYYNGEFTTYSDALYRNKVQKRAAPMSGLKGNEVISSSAMSTDVPILHVTQPGLGLLGDEDFSNPSASAMLCAFRNAKKLICLSQQDLGGAGGLSGPVEGSRWATEGGVPYVSISEPLSNISRWQYYDVNIFNELSGNLARNRHLKIKLLLTNPGATSEDGVEYSYGASVANAYRAFGWFLVKRQGVSLGDAEKIITEQIEFRTLGFRTTKQWQVGPKKIMGNHAKFWAVDDEVCYVGSHNMYPLTKEVATVLLTAHHQEWGAVIGNNANGVVPGIVHDYFDNVFNSSIATQFSPFFLNNLRDPSGPWP